MKQSTGGPSLEASDVISDTYCLVELIESFQLPLIIRKQKSSHLERIICTRMR